MNESIMVTVFSLQQNHSNRTRLMAPLNISYKMIARKAVSLLCLLLCIFLLSQQTHRFLEEKHLQVDDFLEYWTAGKLNLTGGNPYDPDQLLPLQLDIGRYTNVPVMMWNPPGTLAYVMPFAYLDYLPARTIWFLIQLTIIFVCSLWLWKYFNGPEQKKYLVLLVAFLFGPTLQLLKVGQISGFFLLSIVGFLYFEKRGNYFLAGALAGLAIIKPHLLYLVLIAIILWAFQYRKWSILGGLLSSISLTLLIAWIINPAVLQQYIFAALNYPPQEYASPTIGGILRLLFGIDKFWLQFLPTFLGLIWLVLYYKRNRSNWDWGRTMPVMCLASMLTSSYGWLSDYVVLLIPIIWIAIIWFNPGLMAFKTITLSLYMVTNLAVLFAPISQIYFFWLVPVITIMYLVTQQLISQQKYTKDPQIYEGI
jgi:hypothetical protein